MSVKIISSSLNSLSAKSVIEMLQIRDKTKKHIIITPDRASVNQEKQLFDVLDEQCFFDVQVSTLTNFVQSILLEVNNNKKILSKNSGIALVKKILIENKDNLKSFSKSLKYHTFATDLFETLCLFKSCRINPNDIKNTTKANFNNKLNDIKIVYNEYEKFLQNEYTDSFNRLDLCQSVINRKVLKGINFYFIQFDDYTKQAYQLIEKIIMYADNVTFGVTKAKKSDQKPNGNIYLNSVYSNIISMCEYLGVEYTTTHINNNFSKDKNYLVDNFFSYTPNSQQVNELVINRYANTDDEVKDIINFIKYSIITDNKRYKNFTILLSNETTYKNKILKQLDNYDIPYYYDGNDNLDQVIICRLIEDMLSLNNYLNSNIIINILQNPLLQLNQDDVFSYIEYINRFDVIGYNLFNFGNENIKNVLDILKEYYKSNQSEISVKQFSNNLINILTQLNIQQNLEIIIENFYLKSDVLYYKKLVQVNNKINDIFSEVNSVMGDYVCTSKMYGEIFNTYLKNMTLALAPIISDAVFVGNVGSSYIDKADYLFIVGMNEGVLPFYQNDCGIITDSEIDLLDDKNKLNPTINVINKRNKFKNFENIMSYNKKLYISYSLKDNTTETISSTYVTAIAESANIQVVDRSELCNQIANYTIKQPNSFIYNNFNLKTAKDNVVSLLNGYKIFSDKVDYIDNFSTLLNATNSQNYVDNYNFENKDNNIKNASNLFFRNGSTSISQIQSYNNCAYKHFIDYGLRLKPQLKSQIQSLDYGNIIHTFLQNCYEQIISTNDISSLVEIELNKILQLDAYKFILQNNRNFYLLKVLNEELIRMCKAIRHQNEHSSFDVVAKEFEFGKNNNDKNFVFNINGKKIRLVGKIDRIDQNDKYFRVIDYKTGGSVSFDDYQSMYEGRAIQLAVYISVYKNMTDLLPSGAFYMPLNFNYNTQTEFDNYQLKGFLLNTIENIVAYDNRLDGVYETTDFASDIIPLKASKVNEKQQKVDKIKQDSTFKTICINSEQIENMCNYVIKKIEQSVKGILDGNITRTRISNSQSCNCDYCPYVGMCNFNVKYADKEICPTKNKNVDIFKED